MELTVGKLEEILRNYNPGDVIHLGCNCCNRSGSGERLLQIVDKTNQTYGYLEMSFNATHEGKVELSDDKLEFYEREFEKYKFKVNKLERKLKIYKDTLDSINTSLRVNDKRLKWEIKK